MPAHRLHLLRFQESPGIVLALRDLGRADRGARLSIELLAGQAQGIIFGNRRFPDQHAGIPAKVRHWFEGRATSAGQGGPEEDCEKQTAKAIAAWAKQKLLF